MAKFIENFLFGLAFGMGFVIASKALQLLVEFLSR